MSHVPFLSERHFLNRDDSVRRGLENLLLRRLIPWAFGLAAAMGFVSLCTSAQSSTSAEETGTAVQLAQPAGPDKSAPPVTVTLKDALGLAHKNDVQFLAAAGDAKSAHEDRLQSRNALLPSISDSTQFLGTQGNGKTAEGRFVTNDGVHVYREWAVVHEDLTPGNYMLTGYRRAEAAEAIAKAKLEIAQRGLNVTVTKNYYALLVAQRKYATAQQARDQAKRVLDITQQTENQGQASHSDVIKSQIQYGQQQQAFEEANLAMENARLDLAVLLFPTLNENFTVVDDLDSPQALPPFPEVEGMAEHKNPDLRVAVETMREADLDVSSAKGSFLPSLSIETDYGIEANDFALHAVAKAHPELGPLPTLGYFVTASLTVPVWDWGTLRSKLHQAEYKQEQARAELSQAQREVLSNLYASYNEAAVSRAAVDSSRATADLATESLRLVFLRYQAGESNSLEVVDAQNTLTQARNAYDDAEARYRIALANLQTLTGSF
jgi:outer membrane protein TolC